MKLMYPSLVAGLLVLAGCYPTPKATTVEQTPQVKLQSAQHWGVIANHFAQQVIDNAELNQETIYVTENLGASIFEKVFTRHLSGALVNGGVKVMTAGDSGLLMELDIDLVKHSKDRDQGTSFATTAAAGYIWAVAESAPEVSTWSPARSIGYTVVPLAIARDVSELYPSRTRTEVVVTTRIMDGALIRFSETHSYYVPDMATHQFREHLLPVQIPEPVMVKMTNNDVSGGQ